MDREIWVRDEEAVETGSLNTKYIYVRVSTKMQSVERQISSLKKICPSAIVIRDTFSGATMDRPGWKKLMDKVRKGMVTDIYMEEISRMARNKEEGFRQWMWLYENGVSLHFTKQSHVDTQSYKDAIKHSVAINLDNTDEATKELMDSIVSGINKYMVELAKQQIYNVFDEAQFEREMLSKRTSEGLHVAKLNGKRVGRREGEQIITNKSVRAKKKIKELYTRYGGPLNATECIRVCNISRDSFYTYVKQIDAAELIAN